MTLENLDAGAMTFACIAYVNSPRDVGNVKSDVLFEMLERLRAAKLPLTSPQSPPPAPIRSSLGNVNTSASRGGSSG